MIRLFLTTCVFFVLVVSHAQKVEKHITEENVSRIIRTLAADDMMGRPANKPELIEKATVFIENEFKKIGLTPLKGLTNYRQSFHKDMIVPQQLEVMINDQLIPKEYSFMASEKTSIHFTNGAAIQSIDYDTSIVDKRQHLLSKAFMLVRDTALAIVLVAPEFKEQFKELKGFFGKRMINGRKPNKVFVLSEKKDIQHYSVTGRQTIEPMVMANVVGMIEGKSKKEEIVVFSGHYDHIGIRPAVNGDSIANGADDDASGTTAVIALAKYYKKMKNNERTLVFVAFTAEEIGGFGSKYFSEQLNPDQVVAMFNIEMIGKPSKWGQNFAFITGYERSDFGKILQGNLSGTVFEFKPDPYPKQNLFYRSDNATLARLGVPAHTISTDEIDIDKFYHTIDDESETLNVQNITATIRAIALSARGIVAGKETPTRIDKATVK